MNGGQAGQLAKKVEELERKLAVSVQHSEHLSAAIGKEQQKVRFFFGHDLQQLSRENLEQLEAFHHSSLARIQSRLVSPSHAASSSSQQSAVPAHAMPLSCYLGRSGAAGGLPTQQLGHSPLCLVSLLHAVRPCDMQPPDVCSQRMPVRDMACCAAAFHQSSLAIRQLCLMSPLSGSPQERQPTVKGGSHGRNIPSQCPVTGAAAAGASAALCREQHDEG